MTQADIRGLITAREPVRLELPLSSTAGQVLMPCRIFETRILLPYLTPVPSENSTPLISKDMRRWVEYNSLC